MEILMTSNIGVYIYYKRHVKGTLLVKVKHLKNTTDRIKLRLRKEKMDCQSYTHYI